MGAVRPVPAHLEERGLDHSVVILRVACGCIARTTRGQPLNGTPGCSGVLNPGPSTWLVALHMNGAHSSCKQQHARNLVVHRR